jgi:Zn-dependent M32 family carboxypeptidase
MELKKVQSSNIEQIGYEEKYKITLNKEVSRLRIVFTSGGIYDYYNIPKEVYEEFLNAKSIGKYFWANIKNKYDYEKVK